MPVNYKSPSIMLIILYNLFLLLTELFLPKMPKIALLFINNQEVEQGASVLFLHQWKGSLHVIMQYKSNLFAKI